MFDHVHFLFACTEFIRIVNFTLWTAEGRMSYQAVRNDHPGRFKPGAVLNGSFLGGLNSIDVYLLINARLRKIRGERCFACPAHKSNLSRWPVQAGQALR